MADEYGPPEAPTDGGGWGSDWDWGQIAGALAQGAGAYMGAQYGGAQGASANKMSPQAAQWTQMLGLGTIGGFEGELQKGNQALLQGYGNAASMTGALPGMAKQSMKAQLGQVAGAEQGAIQQALKNQQTQLGQVGQQGAASGFYGSSGQAGAQAQVQSNVSQNIANIMAGSAGAKAGIIGSGTSATMTGLITAAQGQQQLGEAHAKASGASYNLMKDKLNTILATGNSWGISTANQKALMLESGGPSAAGMYHPAYYNMEHLTTGAWSKSVYAQGLPWYEQGVGSGFFDQIW